MDLTLQLRGSPMLRAPQRQNRDAHNVLKPHQEVHFQHLFSSMKIKKHYYELIFNFDAD